MDPPSPLHTHESEGSAQSQEGVFRDDLTSVDPSDPGTESLSGILRSRKEVLCKVRPGTKFPHCGHLRGSVASTTSN